MDLEIESARDAARWALAEAIHLTSRHGGTGAMQEAAALREQFLEIGAQPNRNAYTAVHRSALRLVASLDLPHRQR